MANAEAAMRVAPRGPRDKLAGALADADMRPDRAVINAGPAAAIAVAKVRDTLEARCAADADTPIAADRARPVANDPAADFSAVAHS